MERVCGTSHREGKNTTTDTTITTSVTVTTTVSFPDINGQWFSQ